MQSAEFWDHLADLAANPANATEERFWANVSVPDAETGCFVWTGPRDPDGTRSILPHAGSEPAARYAYRLYYGSLAEGVALAWSCGNAACVRPDHLVPKGAARGTTSDRRTRRLTRADRATIRRLFREGEPAIEIAASFGVARRRVYQVVSREEA